MGGLYGVNATVILNGTRSSDPDGDLLQYLWLSTLNSPETTHEKGYAATTFKFSSLACFWSQRTRCSRYLAS